MLSLKYRQCSQLLSHQQPSFSPSCVTANSRIIKIQTVLFSVSNSPAYAVLFQQVYCTNANTWHRIFSNLCPAFKWILPITHRVEKEAVGDYGVLYLFFYESCVELGIRKLAPVTNFTCICLDIG